MARDFLTADRTYYVRTDGSDINDGLSDTPGGAWASIQSGLDFIKNDLDLRGHKCTLQVGNGEYDQVVFMRGAFVGGIPLLRGDIDMPSNVLIKPTGSEFSVLRLYQGCKMSIAGFRMVGNGSVQNCLYVSNLSECFVDGKVEYSSAAFAQVHVTANGAVRVDADYRIVAGAPRHIHVDTNASYRHGGLPYTVSLYGNPKFSTAFVVTAQNGSVLISSSNVTMAGSGRGRRFLAGGSIQTGGGPNYLPGDVAGIEINGGNYS